MCGSRGGTGPDPLPPWKSQKYSFFSNTGPVPLKIGKLRSQHSILGHNRHRHLSHLNGVSLAGRWWPAKSCIWIIPPTIKQKKGCQSWTPSDKTFWIRAWTYHAKPYTIVICAILLDDVLLFIFIICYERDFVQPAHNSGSLKWHIASVFKRTFQFCAV